MGYKTKKGSALPAGPTLASLKREVAKNYKETKVERYLYTLDGSCFNEVMSSPMGFGAQDLKEPYFSLYMYLMHKYRNNLVVKLIEASTRTVELWVKE